MARFIAVQPIYFGGALAFAPGHQVLADHVERYGYDKAGWVKEVADDFRGDDPSAATAAPDTTPPDLRPVRFVDEAAVAVEQAQLAHARGEEPPTGGKAAGGTGESPADLNDTGTAPATPARTAKTQPAAGDTTTKPVTEA